MRENFYFGRFYFNSENARLQQMTYESLQNITISDHRPVFSQFEATLNVTQENENENTKVN